MFLYLNECVIFIQVHLLLFFKGFFIMKQKPNYLDIKIIKNIIVFVARKLLHIFLKNFRNLWIVLHLIYIKF